MAPLLAGKTLQQLPSVLRSESLPWAQHSKSCLTLPHYKIPERRELDFFQYKRVPFRGLLFTRGHVPPIPTYQGSSRLSIAGIAPVPMFVNFTK